MDTFYNQIMLNIRRGMYDYIGSGSCRRVFDMNNGYVVKLAKNEAGMEQNRVEYIISNNDNTNLFAKVVLAARDYRYIIMRKAERIYDMFYVKMYFNVKNEREFFDLKALRRIKNKYNLILEDLNKESSWGIIDNKVVIIDYGFTEKVRDRYY